MSDKSYKNWAMLSDKALMETIGNFIQSHRVNQNKTQEQVAIDAGISRSTLSLLERGLSTRTDSLLRVLRVLDLLSIMDVFRIQEQISPLQYAKMKKRQKKQASPQTSSKIEKNDMLW
jgi:transcriptional regulator with XRE-family HTH domain